MKARIIQLVEKYGNKCVYCECVLTSQNRCVEHFVPKCRGGKNDFDNLYPSCISCNSSKHVYLPEEWLNRLFDANDVMEAKIKKNERIIKNLWKLLDYPEDK